MHFSMSPTRAMFGMAMVLLAVPDLGSDTLPLSKITMRLATPRALRGKSNLRLRGGGGVFEGECFEAPGLAPVSPTLAEIGPLGATCGDPANVPPDITSHSHLDMLGIHPSATVLGRPEADIPDADILVPEWRAQGDNFVRAHVARGMAMVSEGSGALLLMARAIHRRFDSGKQGYMQMTDMNELLRATDGVGELEEEGWEELLGDLNCTGKGVDVRGLVRLYTMPGEQIEKDYDILFPKEQYPNDVVRILRPFALGHVEKEKNSIVNASSESEEVQDIPAWARRCVYEPSKGFGPEVDPWDDKEYDECIPKEGTGHWHEWDWGELDWRIARDLLMEISLEADCKQRTPDGLNYSYLPGPQPTYEAATMVPSIPDPPTLEGMTWDEYAMQRAEEDVVELEQDQLVGPCESSPHATTFTPPLPLPLAAPPDAVGVTSMPPPPTPPPPTPSPPTPIPPTPSPPRENPAAPHIGAHVLQSTLGRVPPEAKEYDAEVDDDGNIILPKGVTWDRIKAYDMSGVPRSLLGQWLSRGVHQDGKTIEQDVPDPWEPLPFCIAGKPWTYGRGEGPDLMSSGKQDPWDPRSPPSVEARRGWLDTTQGGYLVPDKETRIRRAFKLLMVGLDGGGKSSILFALKANQGLQEACVDPVPTIWDINMEEFAYRDLVFMVWDMGGPDLLRPFYKPTSDPSTVDAIVYVVDAVRMLSDEAYQEAARKELWRHLEGDVYTVDILEKDRELAALLASPEAKGGDRLGQDTVTYKCENTVPPEKCIPVDKDGNPTTVPTDTGLWLRHVTKILILANKCEAPRRASIEQITQMLNLSQIKTTRLADAEEGGSPIVILPHHPEVRRLWHVQAVSALTGEGLIDAMEWLYANLEGYEMRSG